MSTLKITVSGPIGIGKTILLAKIKNLILAETEAEGLDIQWESSAYTKGKTPKYAQELFWDACEKVRMDITSLITGGSSSSFLKCNGIRKIILREKDKS